jgi:gliding motility-associated-like protein
MEERDYIKDLFSEKLSQHEVPVNDALWNSISTKIVTNTLVKTGLSLTSKIIGAVTAASLVGVVTLLVFNNNSESNKVSLEKNPIKESAPYKVEETLKNLETSKKIIKITTKKDNNKSISSKEQIEKPSVLDKKSIVKTDFTPYKSNITEIENTTIEVQEVEILKHNATLTESNTINNQEQIIKNAVSSEVVQEEKNLRQAKVGSLPNFFSPNNDGDNDYFFIELEGLSDFSIIVLDKKNSKVFASNDLNFKWDGKDYQNTVVPVGSYVYFFTGKDPQGNVISKSNTLVVKY